MINKNSKISIISPVYQAENIIDQLVNRIIEEISKATKNFEIILVEDGSSDHSWSKILENCNLNEKIKGIKLSRNFGQHYAISAGLKNSIGDYVIVIDCDLQENPIYFKDLIEKADTGVDIVLTEPIDRKHTSFRNIFSNLFHWLSMGLMNNNSYSYGSKYGTLSLLTKKIVKEFSKFQDYHRHYLFIINWLGFSKEIIKIKHEKRYFGLSSYSLKKLLVHALDGIISNTDKLLRLSIYTGFCFSLIGIISIMYIFYQYLNQGFQSGWPSIVVLIIFSTGLILTSTGVLGLYIGRIFDQVKGRPLYIIEEKVNFNHDFS
tara:strand:+ start:3362 stop:4318 length:957 start_codon:yes stop_codon:yes gene_type:complete